MSGMFGADVAQLRELARAFDAASTKLDNDRLSVGNAIQIQAWAGPMASRFRVTWSSEHSVRVAQASARLREAASALRRNADEQERASVSDGGALGGSQSGGRSTLARRWEAMSDAQREALPTNTLAVYGYANSVPPSLRDEANRLLLERCIADTRAPDYARKVVAYKQILAALREHPDAQLLVFDPDSRSQVHVAISLGNVETAHHIGIYTQGWTSRADKPGGLQDPLGEADRLRGRVGSSLHSSGRDGSTSAMVVWMGYDSPQGGIANAQMRQYGESGSHALAEFANGIRQHNANAHITGLGHSYGSFVTGLAAQQTDAFDDVVVFGSPGIGVDHASDLKIGGGLYVLEAPGDVVADSAQFGKDPSRISGAHQLDTGYGPRDPVTAHGSYLRQGSLSQQNIADIVSGRRTTR